MKERKGIRPITRMPAIASLVVGNCFVRVTLDTRHSKSDMGSQYPLSKTYFIKGTGKTVYVTLPYKMTKTEYLEVCRATGKGKKVQGTRTPYEIRKEIEAAFNKDIDRLRRFAGNNPITKSMLESYMGCGTETFVVFWKHFNATKSVGTAAAYEGARKSFLKYVGDVRRTYITSDDVKKWKQGMSNDISLTSIGMYLRAARAVWHEAVRQGLASIEDRPFGKIPQGSDRKREWLGVGQMTKLYEMFSKKIYPSTWTKNQQRNVHHALGLFLFQYLANGSNMADVASLKYNDEYFKSGGKLLSFVRQKTAERSNLEVVIPITEQLHFILDDMANEPVLGAYVFPEILKGETNLERKKKKVAQANKKVVKGLCLIAGELGWSAKPGGAWARHSFATNLAHAGVPERYISEAMGHAIGTVTSRYIDAYPLEQQLRYNSHLLQISNNQETVTISLDEYRRLTGKAV